MRFQFRRLHLIALGLLCFAPRGSATSFEFSYVFNNGVSVTGSFSGTLSGNLITDLALPTLQVNGVEITNLYLAHLGDGSIINPDSGLDWRYGGTASFDGTANNFLLINTDIVAGDVYYSSFLKSITGANGYGGNTQVAQMYHENRNLGSERPYNPASWHVTILPDGPPPPPTVPDSGSTAVFVAMGVLAAVGLRRVLA